MDTVVLNKELQETLTRLYTELEGKHELSVSSPEYSQTQIELLYSYGLIKTINAGFLSGWTYIVQPTYEGQNYLNSLKAHKREKRKTVIWDVVKFLIPTIISVIALIVSILK